jgi:hypothetical protein
VTVCTNQTGTASKIVENTTGIHVPEKVSFVRDQISISLKNGFAVGSIAIHQKVSFG